MFLDHLFQGFGHAGGLKEAGAALEWRVSRADGAPGFADLVWKPVVLVEMKRRGTRIHEETQKFRFWLGNCTGVTDLFGTGFITPPPRPGGGGDDEGGEDQRNAARARLPHRIVAASREPSP